MTTQYTHQYTHVLYHGNCYDGFGSALAAWCALGDEAEYIPVLHGDEPPKMPRSSRVLICDFSYPRTVLQAMHSRLNHLYVIDHHKTAQEALGGLDYAQFDLEHSGAYLTYVHFFGDPVPEFFLYLEDRDLWKFEMEGSKGVSQALRAYPFDFEVWKDLIENVDRLRSEGPTIERFTQQMVGLMCDQAVMRSIEGHEVPVANATVFFSEVGDELCRRHPDAPFAAYYLDRSDRKRQWGFRSRNGFDTSEVAKALGGGGHPGASGFVESVANTLPPMATT